MNSRPVSETAFYRNMLTQKRKGQRDRSSIIMILCGTLQMLWLMLGGFLPLRNILTYSTFLLLSPLVFGTLTATFALFGFRSYRRANKPVTEGDVAQLRQIERMRLFRQAQGIVPSAYTPLRIAFDILAGLFLAASGITCLLLSIPDNGLAKYVYAFGLHGTALYLLYSALYTKPRRAKEIPAESARELKRRFALSEEMDESETQGAQETM